MPSLNPLRVLIVDEFAETYVRFLENSFIGITKFEFHFSLSGKDGISACENLGTIHILILPVSLTDMSCVEFFSLITSTLSLSSVLMLGSIDFNRSRTVKSIAVSRGLFYLGEISLPDEYDKLFKYLLGHDAAEDSEKPLGKPGGDWPQLSIETIRNAIRDHQIVTYFQPIFKISDRSLQSIELLIRWEHPLYSSVSAYDLIVLLRNFHMLDDFFFSQLELGLMFQRSVVMLGGAPINISINLDPIQMYNSDFQSRVCELFDKTGMPGHGITFELTESVLLQPNTIVLENFFNLHNSGCKFSVDDFGTGYSSYLRLVHFPFDEIKLSSEFVRSLVHDKVSKEVVKNILQLGERLSLPVVAEGIENEAELSYLQSLGCALGQGYIFSKPMASSDMLKWLYSHNYIR